MYFTVAVKRADALWYLFSAGRCVHSRMGLIMDWRWRQTSRLLLERISGSRFHGFKSFFDVITKSTTTTEKRLIVAVRAIRETYERLEVSDVGLISSEAPPSDALTKVNDNSILNSILDNDIVKHHIQQWIIRYDPTDATSAERQVPTLDKQSTCEREIARYRKSQFTLGKGGCVYNEQLSWIDISALLRTNIYISYTEKRIMCITVGFEQQADKVTGWQTFWDVRSHTRGCSSRTVYSLYPRWLESQ